jgi:hypothetical protein
MHKSWQLYSNENNGLQQIQLESCLPIKWLKQKNKKKKKTKKKKKKKLRMGEYGWNMVGILLKALQLLPAEVHFSWF